MSDTSTPPALGLSEQIRQRLGDLTPSERRVARALLSGSPTMGLESSARLAQRVGVSGPTVSRFANRLGFDNYAAFQGALRADVAARVMSPVEVYRRHGETGVDDPLDAAGTTLGAAVTASLRGLSLHDFERATAYLCDSRRQVIAVGGWFSHLVAGYFGAMLRQFRPRVRWVPPMASERTAAIADVEKKDVAVVFDFRRYERDTAELAQALHDAGARIVLFTDPWLSPIADISDAVLPAQVVGPSPFESLTPTLAVVETLLTAVAEALGEVGDSRFEHFGGIADRWVRPWPVENG
ncbi:MAG: MurR/RpiR family transcriptional regulator [Nocardioidaceae bacterium]